MANLGNPTPLPPKPGSVKVVRALYSYSAQHSDELSFNEGDILYIIGGKDTELGWLKAKCKANIGLIPGNYVELNSETIDNPLQEAAKRGNLLFLNECLDNKVSVNSLDKSGSTALHWAARGGHIDCVKSLLSIPSIQVNVKNKMGDSPLHSSAWKGDVEIVNLLLTSGADILFRNNEFQLPYDIARNVDTGRLLKPRITGSDAEYGNDLDSD